MDSSFKNERFLSWPGAVRESTDSLGVFVLICQKQIVEAFVTKCLQEPFAVEKIGASSSDEDHGSKRKNEILHVRARQLLQCIEAQASILCQDRAAHL